MVNQLTTNEILLQSTTPTSTTRGSLRNKTMSKLQGLMEVFSTKNQASDTIINILENLPLYLTLSFLLSRYLILLLGCVADWLQTACFGKVKDSEMDKTENFLTQYIHSAIQLDNEAKRQVSVGIDDYLKNLDYKHENHFTSQIREETNHNYSYIKNLLKNVNVFDLRDEKEATLSIEINKRKEPKPKQVSFIMNIVESIYKNIPYMKYSKQFVNTFTVAFMVVYFFTLFGFRISNLFGNAIVKTIELLYRLVFRGMIPTFNFDDHNFNAEFRFTCLLTSFIISVQLFLTIRNFHKDLLKLHRGDKEIGSLITRYRDPNYRKTVKEKRDRISASITADSLHFPGYLIAHLVYGYIIILFVVFCFVILFKLTFYFPKLLQYASQVLLPLIILVSLKLISLKLATRIIFLREDTQRITNLAPYYTISYFNFFFDCFLGLVACMSRVWQTTVVSLISIPRLDKSMFNKDSDLIMRRLDKGHLAYLNYVRMEHWYNNPVANGFCEILIESMLYSQIYKVKFTLKATQSISIIAGENEGKSRLVLERAVSQHTQMSSISVTETLINSPSLFRSISTDPPQPIKSANKYFQYSSFLRLRNMMYLCLLLKSNPSLRKLRYHYLVRLSQTIKPAVEVQTFGQFWDKKIGKRIEKIRSSLIGIGSKNSSPVTHRKIYMAAPPMMMSPRSGVVNDSVLSRNIEDNEEEQNEPLIQSQPTTMRPRRYSA